MGQLSRCTLRFETMMQPPEEPPMTAAAYNNYGSEGGGAPAVRRTFNGMAHGGFVGPSLSQFMR